MAAFIGYLFQTARSARTRHPSVIAGAAYFCAHSAANLLRRQMQTPHQVARRFA